MSDPQQDRMQTPPQHGGAESTTGNEFDAPGTNYPDTGKPDESARDESGADAQPAPADDDPSHEAVGVGVIGGAQVDPDHHGQDGGREKVWAGSSQDALSGEQEQRLPSMSQNNASDVEKVTGIVAQVRGDIASGDADEVRHVLAQRLEQAGLALGDDEIDELTRQITTGD